MLLEKDHVGSRYLPTVLQNYSGWGLASVDNSVASLTQTPQTLELQLCSLILQLLPLLPAVPPLFASTHGTGSGLETDDATTETPRDQRWRL